MISKQDFSSSFLTIKDKISNLPDIDLSTKPLLVIIGSNKCGKTTLSEALSMYLLKKMKGLNLKVQDFSQIQ